MEASILLVADFANVDASGKLNVIGAFNRLFTSRFPVIHPQMHLVVRLTAELGEFDQERNLKVILWTEDGDNIWETPDILFNVKSPEGGRRGEHNAVIGLQRMGFEKPGAYEFRVYVNKEFKGTIPLEIVLVPEKSGGE